MHPTLSLLEQAFCDNLEKPYFNKSDADLPRRITCWSWGVNFTLDAFSHADCGDVDAVEKHLEEKQKLHQAWKLHCWAMFMETGLSKPFILISSSW